MTPPRRSCTRRLAPACPILAGILLCLPAPASAQERGRTRAVVVPAGPKVEASLADPLWKKAPPLHLHPVPGQDGKLVTRVRLLFGPTSLYAAVECQEPDKRLHAKARTRDGNVWADDCIELYVLPHPTVGYKQIAVNPLATVFDQAFRPGARGGARGWNASVRLDVAVQPGKGWTLALSVPYKDLGAYAGDDQTWRLNVTRVRKGRGGAPDQEYTWSFLPSAEFHQRDFFGVVDHIDVRVRRGGATRRVDEVRAGLRWTRPRTVRGVRRCFPHPLDPHAAWCATTGGLLATSDGGDNWTPVASAASRAVGEATCLAVSTLDPQVICLGTDARGLFLSSDGGETWKPLGGDAERYASNHIEWVDFCPSDPSRRTLLATHGVAASGMSVSRDLGATWEVLGTDRFLTRFVKQAETLIAIGSMTVSEGRVWGIHRSGTDGQRWEETVRNIRPAAPATTPLSRWQFFVATLNGTILQSSNDGKSWTRLVRSDGSSWTSLFFTNGATDRARILAAYDPHRQGLCLSRHRFANGLGERQNRGLYIGPYVKSGANCVANANGTVYYVAMNNSLWIGRRVLPTHGPAVVQARCLPCSVRIDNAAMHRARGTMRRHIAAIAANGPRPGHVRAIATAARTIAGREAAMSFTVRADVRHPDGPRAIRSATVDLSALGGSRATPLHDDGKHNDRKPGDGTYGATARFSPAIFQRPGFRETRLLTVKATDKDGSSDSWPALVTIPRGPVAANLRRGGYSEHRVEGPVAVRWAGNEGVRPKTSALRFTATGPGPWRGAWIMPGDGVNCAGLKWLAFHIKGDTDQDLRVHLVDYHKIGTEGFFDVPHFSAPVPLLAGGYLEAIAPTYQAVRVPVAKLLPKGVYFLRWHTAGLGLSVPEGGKPGTYHVDLIQLEP